MTVAFGRVGRHRAVVGREIEGVPSAGDGGVGVGRWQRAARYRLVRRHRFPP
jgi:hypothetical protein